LFSQNKSLTKIRQDQKIPELVLRDGDEEYNNKIVRPILTQAATEYGKIITMLANKGLEELAPEEADYFANMTLLAHASAVAVTTREAALKRADQMEGAIKIGNGYFRPQIGGGSPSIAGSSNKSEAPKPTLEDGVNSVLGSVLQKRGK